MFERRFRPVIGEMGDFDEGMLIEYEKGYRVDLSCVYWTMYAYMSKMNNLHFWPDMEAIYAGYELSHWLNCSAW